MRGYGGRDPTTARLRTGSAWWTTGSAASRIQLATWAARISTYAGAAGIQPAAWLSAGVRPAWLWSAACSWPAVRVSGVRSPTACADGAADTLRPTRASTAEAQERWRVDRAVADHRLRGRRWPDARRDLARQGQQPLVGRRPEHDLQPGFEQRRLRDRNESAADRSEHHLAPGEVLVLAVGHAGGDRAQVLRDRRGLPGVGMETRTGTEESAIPVADAECQREHRRHHHAVYRFDE